MEAMEQPESAEDLRAAYRADTARLLRQRLTVTVGLFVLLVGISVVLEGRYHPEREHTARLVYLTEVVACLGALVACRVPRLREGAATVAAALAAGPALLPRWDNRHRRGPGGRFAAAPGCLPCGLRPPPA